MPEIADITELVNDHGWPQTLCVIEVVPGKYAYNNCDTSEHEDPPQVIDGLAVFSCEASAILYACSPNGISGTIVPKTFEECRAIALTNPKASALLLMDGSRIRDIIHIR